MPVGVYVRTKPVWNKGKTGIYSQETLKKISDNNGRGNLGKTGELNHCWKGEAAKYQAKHKWIREHHGRADHCQYCGSTDRSMYHWANISGEYLRELSDWLQLCVPHHKLFDNGKIKITDIVL